MCFCLLWEGLYMPLHDVHMTPLRDACQAVRLITAATGRAVVAHMPTLGPTWHATFASAIPDLVAAGLWGLEGYSSEISEQDHVRLCVCVCVCVYVCLYVRVCV